MDLRWKESNKSLTYLILKNWLNSTKRAEISNNAALLNGLNLANLSLKESLKKGRVLKIEDFLKF